MTVIDVGPSIWLYTLHIAALIGAPSGSGRSKGEFWMFTFATGFSGQRTLWIEPDDRCHRGVPMGAYRAGEAARLGAFGIRRHGVRDSVWRIALFQQDGVDDSGRGLADA
jgi:hypothetical protein